MIDTLLTQWMSLSDQLHPPTWDLENGLLRAWWFDPLSATVFFGIFINWYWYEERKRGLSTNNHFYETVTVGLGPLYSSLVAYWIGLYIWKCFIPPAASIIPDGIPTDTTSFLYLLSAIVSGIILYAAVFFFLHWAMHEVPGLRHLHARHHEQQHVEARDVLRHSIVDGSLQVLVNILVQRSTPWGVAKTRLARFLHNMIVIWMLTESHTASPSPNIWRRFLVGVREHRLHHRGDDRRGHLSGYGRYHRHQQFFGYLDNARAMMAQVIVVRSDAIGRKEL